MRQGLQAVGHRLRRGTGDVGNRGELASRKQATEGKLTTVTDNHRIAIQAGLSEPTQDITGRMLWAHLDQIASLPGRIALKRPQCKVEAGFAEAARIDLYAFDQLPASIMRSLPIGHVQCTGEQRKMMLPMAQRGRVAVVHFYRIE